MIETEGVSDKKLMNHETPNVLIGFVWVKAFVCKYKSATPNHQRTNGKQHASKPYPTSCKNQQEDQPLLFQPFYSGLFILAIDTLSLALPLLAAF
nr:hypothetical protein CFP56_60624 [Quercus suber]